MPNQQILEVAVSKFKKKSRVSQDIPTSALPDIIFILLFFFIVTTKPKSADEMVENEPVPVTELEKIEDQHLVTYIFIGKPVDEATYGSTPKIQINDRFVALSEVQKYVANEKEKLGDKANQMIVVLKVDRNTDYGIVSDVKEKLREIDQRIINFNGAETSKID